jgi:exopolyphosphatase
MVDLDSIASSIAYAYIQSTRNKGPIVPLMQMSKGDFILRSENIYALKMAGLDTSTPESGIPELLTVDEVVPDQTSTFPSDRFALVDHNRLKPMFLQNQEEKVKVVGVIDHHEDEELYQDTADPRVIQKTGSCSSLVAMVLKPDSDTPPEMATLLLSALLIDTTGLKEGGKAIDVDREAAALLVQQSTIASAISPTAFNNMSTDASKGLKMLTNVPQEGGPIAELTQELQDKKFAVSQLGCIDLLRRDYKEYIYTPSYPGAPKSIKAGIGSVPLGFKDWIGREEFWTDAAEWMKQRELAILGIQTSFREESKKGKMKHKREQILIASAHASEGVDADELAEIIWSGMEKVELLELEEIDYKEVYGIKTEQEVPEGLKFKVFKQHNADATRKQTAPALKEVIEGKKQKL